MASAVGVEVGQTLQASVTADIGEGAAPSDVIAALRDVCHQDPVVYARVLERLVLASLDELQVIAGYPRRPDA